MSDSSAEHKAHGRHHQGQDDPAARLVKWTIVLAVASWAAVGITGYSVKAQRDDARDLLQAQISVELDKEFDSAEMRRARRLLASELLAKGAVSEYRIFDFFDKVSSYRHDQRVDGVTIYEALSYYVVRYWLASRDTVKAFRRDQGDESYYVGFEDLSGWMLSHEAGVRGKTVNDIAPSAREIDRFLHEEAALAD